MPMIPLLALTLALGADRLTLEQAVAEARAANATLPAARADAASAEARAAESRAALYPHVELDADVQVARPGAYSDSHALAKVLAATTIFDAGRRRAELRSALADLRTATAGIRKADADLTLEVRTRFDELTAIDEELGARADALDRLRQYLALIQARRSGGQGVGADVLKTQARLAGDAGDLESLSRDRGDSAHELNDLLGREPEQPLVLAPPTDEPLAFDTEGHPWEGAPDVVQAQAQLQSVQEQVGAAKAERAPRIDARAEVGGVKPMLGSTLDATNAVTAPGDGFGGAVGLSLTLPLWDFGAIRARIAQADAAVARAQAEAQLATRAARLEWSKAWSDARSLEKELAVRREGVPVAEDAYLSTEALYRGGVGTALDVLDAYGAWVDAEVKLIATHAALRDARARILRWEGK